MSLGVEEVIKDSPNVLVRIESPLLNWCFFKKIQAI